MCSFHMKEQKNRTAYVRQPGYPFGVRHFLVKKCLTLFWTRGFARHPFEWFAFIVD